MILHVFFLLRTISVSKMLLKLHLDIETGICTFAWMEKLVTGVVSYCPIRMYIKL